MNCRSGCAACCISPSISSPIPGMPEGKPAGVPCVQLDDQFGCKLWQSPERPLVCSEFLPEPQICGANRDEALEIIRLLEISSL